MNAESAPEGEPYLVGGNLLNEQDNIMRVKRDHEGGKAASNEDADEDLLDADPSHDGPKKDGPKHDDGAGGDDAERGEGGSGATGGGAKIPDQPADSIVESRQTHSGGAVPPGSFGGADKEVPDGSGGPAG